MLFFSCVDTKSTSTQAQWLFGLRKNLRIKIGKRDGYAADDSSIKAPPLALQGMAKAMEA